MFQDDMEVIWMVDLFGSDIGHRVIDLSDNLLIDSVTLGHRLRSLNLGDQKDENECCQKRSRFIGDKDEFCRKCRFTGKELQDAKVKYSQEKKRT